LQAVQEKPGNWVLRQQGSTVQMVYQHKVSVESLYKMLRDLADAAGC
jgi:hypothetical protein